MINTHFSFFFDFFVTLKILRNKMNSIKIKSFWLCLFLSSFFATLANETNYADSIWISDDTGRIILADRKPFLMLMKKDINIWNGKLSFDIVSLKTGVRLWTHSFTPNDESVFMTDHGLLHAGNNIVIYDYESGKKLSKIKIDYAWHDDKKDVVVGYNGNKLAAYKMSTAEKLWETEMKIKGKGAWSSSKFLDEDNLIFVSKNMAGKVNIPTGECCYYPLKREIHDNKGNALKLGLSLMAGVASVATGSVAVPIYSFSKFKDLGSDIIHDGNGKYYVADRNALICVDEEFNELWRTPFPNKMGSSSRIYLRDGAIDLLNIGTGNVDGHFTNVGKPFWASYNANSGENINFSVFPDKWNESELGNHINFAPDSLYYYSDSLQKFVAMDHHHDSYPVITADLNNIIMIGNDFNFNDSLRSEDMFKSYIKLDDGMILRRWLSYPEYVWIVDNGYVKQTFPDDIIDIFFNDQGLFIVKNQQLLSPDISESYILNNQK